MSITIKPWIKHAYQEQFSSINMSLPTTYLQFVEKISKNKYVFSDSEFTVICEISDNLIKKLNNFNGVEFDRSMGHYYKINDYNFKKNTICTLKIISMENMCGGEYISNNLKIVENDMAIQALFKLKSYKNTFDDVIIDDVKLDSSYNEKEYKKNLLGEQVGEISQAKNSIEFDKDLIGSLFSSPLKDDIKTIHITEKEKDTNGSIIEKGKILCKNIFNFFSIKMDGDSEEILKNCEELNCSKCELIEERVNIRYRFDSAFTDN